MKSGARCEEALTGTALGGIAVTILTFFLRKRRDEVLEKLRTLCWKEPKDWLGKWGACGLRKAWILPALD